MQPVALITGAARGIGQAIAEAFLADHLVAITWRSTPPKTLPPSVHTIQADLTEDTAPARVIDEVIAKFGRLDVIVNNAGVIAPSDPDKGERGALRSMLDINVLAAQALLQAARPHLKAGASIVSISSENARLPPKGAALFGASKAALELWTRGIAKELGPSGIRVNAVAPGAVNIPQEPRPPEMVALFSELTAMGRLAKPEEIAKAVRFLAGPDASFITGEVLTVSGGYRL